MKAEPQFAVPAPTQRAFYRPELDVLRFVAAFGVFVFHSFPKESAFWIARGFSKPVSALITSIVGAGAFGVDLFFALSAFLITELLLRERELRGSVDVNAFYIRRILRIWPLYFFFIVLACGLTLLDKSQHVGWTYALSYIFLAGNWIVVHRGAPASVLVPLWSVSVEEQFYLLWPQAVRRVGKRGIAMVSLAMLVVANISRFWLVRHQIGGDSVWCNTLVRLDPIALGILFALLARRYALSLNAWWRALCFVCGFGLWMYAAHFGRLHDLIPSFSGTMLGYPAAAVGSALFLLCAYRGPESGLTFLQDRRFIYLGQISYGIYVYHELGLLLSHYAFGAYTKKAAGYAVYWVCALAVTISLAAVSYQLIEKPFLKLKKRFTFVKSRPV